MNEKDPGYRNACIEERLHIRQELRSALTEPIHEFSDRIETFVDHHSSREINQWAHFHYLDGPIPYSLSTLPVGLVQAGYAISQKSLDSYDRQMQSFWAEHRRTHESTPGRHDFVLSHEAYSMWMQELTRLQQNRNKFYTPTEARRYGEAHAIQLERGFITLDFIAARLASPQNRTFNTARGIFEAATGQHQYFLAAETSNRNSHVASWVQAPITEYGRDHTIRSMRTAGFIIDFLQQDIDLWISLSRVAGKHRDLIQDHTLRANGHMRPSRIDTLTETLQEAVLAVLGCVMLQTSEKVEGYNDSDSIMQQIDQDDLINSLTFKSPLSVAQSALYYGVYFPGLVQPHDGNTLDISNAGSAALRTMRKKSRALSDHEWRDYNQRLRQWERGDRTEPKPKPPVRHGLPCSFSGGAIEKSSCDPPRDVSEVSRLGKVFTHIYPYITTDPEDVRQGDPSHVPQFGRRMDMKQYLATRQAWNTSSS